ncbi:MAG: glycoside hydrolase family 78 protein [Acidobacteria bacterium]|nr:glycoside hydrolase family 78 protein [Acidobacteriota bacterium]
MNWHKTGFGPPISDRRYHYYETRDIGPFLRPGKNVLAAHAYSLATGTEDFHGGRGLFLLEGSAGAVRLDSGADWKYIIPPMWQRDAPRQSFQLHFVEIADLRKELTGWIMPGFDDSAWKPAVVIGRPPQGGYENLVAHDLGDIDEVFEPAAAVIQYGEVSRAKENKIPAIQVNHEPLGVPRTVRISEGWPIRVETTAKGRDAAIILDMGRLVIGCPYFEADAGAGTVVDVSISEYLDKGRVLAARRITSDQNTYLTDRITLRSGRQQWKRYDYNAYRYIQLTIRDAAKPLALLKAGTMRRDYRYAGEATFRSSDAVLDRIFEMAKWSHKINTHWGYCGSGWREHAQWSDLTWAAMNECVFNDAPLMRYYLHQITLSQDETGRMRFPYPGNEAMELPEQTMWLGEELSRSALDFGDVQMMRDLLPAMDRADGWFRKHLAPDGLMTTAGGWKPMWLVIDWGYPFCNNPSPGELATLNIIYYDFLRSVERTAARVGERDTAARYGREADTLGATIQRTFYSAAERRYYEKPGHESPSPLAATLAVQYGLAPAADRAAIFDWAVGKDLRPGKASPWFMHNVLETFGQVGRYEDGIASLKRYWGSFLKGGATAFWELWNIPGEDVHPLPGYTAEMGGQTITYASGPAPFVVRHILGVQPLADDFAKARVAPHFAGLTSAEGSAPTPHGDVRVGWQCNAASTEVRVVVPQGITAEFELPYADALPVVAVDNRPFFDGVRFTPDSRISAPARSGAVLHMQLAPGTYLFIAGK